MNSRLKFFSLFFAVLLHAVIAFIFIYNQPQRSVFLTALWSGGRSGYDVTLVSLTSDDVVEKTSEDGVLKQDQVVVKKKVIAAQSKTISSGQGDSDTPKGDIGSGLDKNGAISNTAPSTLAQIRKQIMQHKEYPLVAKENHIAGTVQLKFKINQDGSLNTVDITQSSGQNILDAAAKKAITKAAPYPYYPGSITLALEYELR